MEVKPCGLISVIPPTLQEEWAANLTGLAGLFRPAALILKHPAPAVLAKTIAGAKTLELAVLLAGDAGGSGCRRRGRRLSYFGRGCQPGADSAWRRCCHWRRLRTQPSRRHGMCGGGCRFHRLRCLKLDTWEEAAELSLWWDEMSGVPAALDFGTGRPDETVLAKARPDFLMIEEANRAGESLTFATEFGLQGQV